MWYLKTLLSKAWKDTWKLVSESPVVTVILTAATFGFAVLLTYLWRGEQDVISLIKDALTGFLSNLLIFGMVFISHLLFLSPKRLFIGATNAKDIAEADLKELTDPKLSIEFVNQTGIDHDLYGIAFRVRVQNVSNKRLENVSLKLGGIDHDGWRDGKPYEVRQIAFPFRFRSRLTSTIDSTYLIDCGLNGRESLLFDIAMVKVEGGAMYTISLAPFMPPPDTQHRQWVSTNNFDAQLNVSEEPRKLFTFTVIAYANYGAPTQERKTLLFKSHDEPGLPDWITPTSSDNESQLR